MNTQLLLHHQAKRIETVFHRHDVPDARVNGGTLFPRFVRYTIQSGQSTIAAALQGEIARALDAPCHLYHHGAAIHVETPRPDPQPLPLQALYQRLIAEGPRQRDTIPPTTALLGIASDQAPLLLRLPSDSVRHALVLGSAGAGKTNLARTIATSLALHNSPRALQIFLIGQDLSSLAVLHHMHDHAAEADNQPAVDLVNSICAELQARQREGYGTPALVVLIDELNDLLHALQQTAEGSGPLQRLLQAGPDLGLHIVACATPTRPVQQLAARFPIHLIGSTSAQQQAFLPDDGPPLPVPATNLWGSGDFAVVAGNQVARMQAAYVSEGPASADPVSGSPDAVRLHERAAVLARPGARTERPGGQPGSPPTLTLVRQAVPDRPAVTR